MERARATWAAWVFASAVAACGGGQTAPSASPGVTASIDAGVDAQATPDPPRPFASNPQEATDLVNQAVAAKSSDMEQCVAAARTRMKDPRAKITIELGADQEGHLIGVKLPSSAKADQELLACVRTALSNAPFPKSHAGIISIRKSYEVVSQ